MKVNQAKCLSATEQDNLRLKRLLENAALDTATLWEADKGKFMSPARRGAAFEQVRRTLPG